MTLPTTCRRSAQALQAPHPRVGPVTSGPGRALASVVYGRPTRPGAGASGSGHDGAQPPHLCDRSALTPPPPASEIVEYHLVAAADRDHFPIAPPQRLLGPPAILDQPRLPDRIHGSIIYHQRASVVSGPVRYTPGNTRCSAPIAMRCCISCRVTPPASRSSRVTMPCARSPIQRIFSSTVRTFAATGGISQDASRVRPQGHMRRRAHSWHAGIRAWQVRRARW